MSLREEHLWHALMMSQWNVRTVIMSCIINNLLQWTSMFTEAVNETRSTMFVKNLVAVAISNVTYLRAIFPEHAFGDRSIEGVFN